MRLSFAVKALRSTVAAATAGIVATLVSPATAQPPPRERPDKMAQATPEQATPAQPTDENVQSFGDWLYGCRTVAEAEECAIAQTVVDPQSSRVVLVWRIRRNRNGDLVGVWETPTGVRVRRGLTLDFGPGEQYTIPFEFCSPRHCRATGTFAPDFIDTLASSQKATATLLLVSGQTVTFNLSPRGLPEALAALRQ